MDTNNKNTSLHHLAKGFRISFIGKFGGRGIELITQLILARYLFPAGYGFYSIVVTLLRIMGIISPMGLDKGVIRFGSAYWEKGSSKFKEVVFQSGILAFGTGIIFALLLYVFAPFIAGKIYHNHDLIQIMRWGSLYLIFFSITSVLSSALRVAKKFSFSILSFEFGLPLFEFLIVGVLVYFGIDIYGAVIAKVAAVILSFVISLFFILKVISKRPLVSGQMEILTHSLIKYSVPVSLAGIFYSMLLWSDRLILGYFHPESYVGVYQAVSQFPSFFLMILTAINLVFFPIISILLEKKNQGELKRIYETATRLGLYISSPVLIFLLVFPHEIITVFFSQEYISGTLALQILSIAQFINVSTGAIGPLLVISDNQNKWLFINLGALLLSITLNFTLVPRFGLTGSAVSTGISIIVLFSSGVIFVKQRLELWPYTRATLKIVFSTLLSLGILVLLKRILVIPGDLLYLLIFGVATVVIFAVTQLVFGFHPDDKEFVKNIVARIE